MPRPTGDVFLTDLAAHPENDTLRLVYADWLKDHGNTTQSSSDGVLCRKSRSCPVEAGRALFPWRIAANTLPPVERS
jgi:uncharacterized protein (TIGR02996 family)